MICMGRSVRSEPVVEVEVEVEGCGDGVPGGTGTGRPATWVAASIAMSCCARCGVDVNSKCIGSV